MKRRILSISCAIALAAGLLGTRLAAQSSQAEKDAAVAAHIEAARKAAGMEHTGIFEGICTQFAQPAARRLSRFSNAASQPRKRRKGGEPGAA